MIWETDLMKRLVYIIVLISTIFGLFTCRQKSPAPVPIAEEGKAQGLRILATFLPMYIFTVNVVKGVPGAEVAILLPPSGSPHDYMMTPGDAQKIAAARVLVMNGLGIESFIGDSYRKVNPGLKIIVASEGIQTLPDSPPGREWEVGTAPEEHHEQGAPNPHVWVSPANAAVEVRNIGEALAKIDPANAETYRKNAATYAEQLLNLAIECKNAVAGFKNKKIVTVHNAFDYLAADTGLKVIAVLRMDATAEPRPAELARIEERLRAERPAAILAEPQFSDKLAKTLAEETGVPIFNINPIDTGELRDDYYIQAMRANLTTLTQAMR